MRTTKKPTMNEIDELINQRNKHIDNCEKAHKLLIKRIFKTMKKRTKRIEMSLPLRK